MRIIKLYDLACRARLVGEIDPQLQEFVDSFEEPKRCCLRPDEPCNKQLTEYTVWLTVRGVERGENIVRNPNQPLTLSEAVDVYAKLSRDVITCSHEESMNTLDSLQDFISIMLRYPMLPQLAMDTKECPECYYEADITLGTWEDVRRKISCYHFTLRHEQFVFGQKDSPVDDSSHHRIDDNSEMVRAGPCGSVFLTEASNKGDGERLKPKFLEQLESLKRRDEMTKQKTLGKEIFHQLKSHSHTLEELEAPRYLSAYPLRYLYQFYGSLNRSLKRAKLLAEQYPEAEGDRRRAQPKVEELRMHLVSTASTGTNDKLLSYVCMAMIGPVRRYKPRYNFTAERVVLFKHLIASGFPIETASSLVRTINASNRVSMTALPLDKGVELQLKKTFHPTTYNRKIASLIWLFSHITAYCTLRKLNHGYVRTGDSIEDMACDGIYVFDQDRVGFRLSRDPRLSSDYTGSAAAAAAAAASAYMPFSRIVELLALRDSVQERLCQ